MRRTRLGTLVLAVGWLCFPIALVAGTLAPAILGVLLVAAAARRRPNAATVDVSRTLPADAASGEPFEVEIVARAPGGSPLLLHQPIPQGVAVLDAKATPGRGVARLALRLVASRAGVVTLGPPVARVQDAWGLWEMEVTAPMLDHVRVVPGTSAIESGRRAGRRLDVGAKAKRRLEGDVEPEIERLRDHQPGDRIRDIDWAHSTKLSKLISRELTRRAPLPVIVLLQATASTRLQRRVSKLDTGIDAALGILAAANAAALPAGLVAWDDAGVRAQVRIGSTRQVLTLALKRLAALPARRELEEVEATGEAPERVEAPTAQEREFLDAIGTFDPTGARGLTPLESALGAVARVSSQPALVIALLDVEEEPALARAVASRLQRRGHRCVVAGFASGAHHYGLREVDDAVLASLVRWRVHRDRAAKACRTLRVPFFTLPPGITPAAIKEVVGSAR